MSAPAAPASSLSPAEQALVQCAASTHACAQTLQAILALAQLERKERKEAKSEEEYGVLERLLGDIGRQVVDTRFRTQFAAIAELAGGSLSDQARAVYNAGVQHRQSAGFNGDAERAITLSHLQWYYEPVHQMLRLHFQNAGPESAYGIDLRHARTLLFLIMWHAAIASFDADCIYTHMTRYNRDVKLIRTYGSMNIRALAQTATLEAHETVNLLESIFAPPAAAAAAV